jgi:hypothetical protein
MANASNEICRELACEYNNFTQESMKTFTGYKLACKKNLNYYSIVTGLFRYRPKRVSENSYHGLHEKCGTNFNERLVDRVAVFRTQGDAYNALIKYADIDTYHGEIVMLELTISGDLESASYTNSQIEGRPVVIGHTIEKVKEIKSYGRK